jgi:Putative beta-lactamase-inhibitor-like, PepSY-like
MKKILFVFSLLIFFTAFTSAEAQVINVPKKSKEHFFKKYPDAKNADWNNNVANYIVKFQLNGATSRAYYNLDGTWDYTETYLEESQVPEQVKDSFSKSRYAEWNKENYASVENNKGKTSYRIVIKKGIEKKTIFFDKNGKEVKSSRTL